MNKSPVVFGVVILAAGASSRMGQPKLVLPWGNVTILAHLIQQWQRAGARQIAVVYAATNRALIEELDRLSFPVNQRILNPEPERGMFSSICRAAQWRGWEANVSHWVLVLGDQPHLLPRTLAALVELGSAHPDKICQLRYEGRPRHPVWLPRSAWLRLQSTESATLREYLHNAPDELNYLDYHDPGLAMDLDRPRDYQAAVELYVKRPEDDNPR